MASGSKKREGSHSAGANRGPWFAAVPPTGAPASQIWRGRGVSPTLGIPYGRGCPGVGGPGGRDRGGGRRCALRISIPMPCGDGDSISPECSSLSCALNAAHPATNPAGILLLIRSSSAPSSPYNRMQMQLSSEAQIPDGMLAAIALRNEKPRLGVPSWNPALHQGIDASNSTIVLGLQSTAALNRIGSRSTGKERDTESGNDYFGARYYASSMGRWLSPDKPFADQHTSNPQSWNLYAYGRNNPLKNVDLNGFKVLQAVLAEAVSKINALPGGNLYLDFAGIQGLHGHPSLNASNNFDGWHSDHSSANSVIIPNNGIVSGFFRALFGLANKDQVDTGKAIVAAAKSSGQDVAFDTYSNGVNAAGQVAQGMSAGDLQSATVVGPNANSPAPVQAMDQADGDATQIYISINDPALALALFGSQSVNDWTSEFGDRVHVTDQPSHNLNQYRGAQGKAPWPGFCPAEFASCN